MTDTCLICFYSFDDEGLLSCLRQFIQVLAIFSATASFLVFICQMLQRICEDDNILEQYCKALAHCGQ